MATETTTTIKSDLSGEEADGSHTITVSGPDWRAILDVTKDEAEQLAKDVKRLAKVGRRKKEAAPVAPPDDAPSK